MYRFPTGAGAGARQRKRRRQHVASGQREERVVRVVPH